MCVGNGGVGICFQGPGKQANTFGILGSRDQEPEEKHFRELGRKVHFSIREQGAENTLLHETCRPFWCVVR